MATETGTCTEAQVLEALANLKSQVQKYKPLSKEKVVEIEGRRLCDQYVHEDSLEGLAYEKRVIYHFLRKHAFYDPKESQEMKQRGVIIDSYSALIRNLDIQRARRIAQERVEKIGALYNRADNLTQELEDFLKNR